MGQTITKNSQQIESEVLKHGKLMACKNSQHSFGVQDENYIYFYDAPSDRVKPEHIFLNNFAETPFIIDGIQYKTVEHYYQVFFRF